MFKYIVEALEASRAERTSLQDLVCDVVETSLVVVIIAIGGMVAFTALAIMTKVFSLLF